MMVEPTYWFAQRQTPFPRHEKDFLNRKNGNGLSSSIQPLRATKASGDFNQKARESYRVIAIADTARDQPALSINILEKQPSFNGDLFPSKK